MASFVLLQGRALGFGAEGGETSPGTLGRREQAGGGVQGLFQVQGQHVDVAALFAHRAAQHREAARAFPGQVLFQRGPPGHRVFAGGGGVVEIAQYRPVRRRGGREGDILRQEGIKAGLVRPVTLFPFPEKEIARLSAQVKSILSVELNLGQMVEDVRLAADGRCPVGFYGRQGGNVYTPEEIVEEFKKFNNLD